MKCYENNDSSFKQRKEMVRYHNFCNTYRYRKERIIVIEDEEFCISALNTIFTKIGINTSYQVDICINGSEAFGLVQESYKAGLSYKIIFKE